MLVVPMLLVLALVGYAFLSLSPFQGTAWSRSSTALDAPPIPLPVVTAEATTPEPTTPRLPSRVPGLGRRTRADIPAGSTQVVVVTGASRTSSRSSVVLYQRTADGWTSSSRWAARNGRKGWSARHRENDLKSPIGVFSLTDAGGLLPDVGTKLTYDRSSLFTIDRIGMLGQSLTGSYDYVIAINYNRRIGRSPLDRIRPQGSAKGGGIWLHVASSGPTQACIGLSRPHLRTLLKTLDPKRKPVIVMGDAQSLRR